MRAHVLLRTLSISLLFVIGCHHHRKPKTPQGGAAPSGTDVAQGAQPQQPPALAATGSGAGLTRVTSDGVDETTPQLSPDGKTLIFVAWSQVQDASGNAVAQSSVMGVDPASGAARTVYTNGAAGANWPTWTPKGSLVYAAMTTGTQSLVKTLTSAPNAAFTVIVDGKTAQNPSWPAVSPDGGRLAFEANINGAESIVTTTMSGSKLTVLGPGFTPSWSPDGKRLAFSRQVGQAYEIMLMEASTGGGLTQVTNAGCSSSKPKFSPDGHWLVFESNCGYNTQPGGSETTTWNIFAVKTDGTGLTQLTSGPGESGQPFWGKDGFIYFESNYDGSSNRDLWKLKPAGDLAGPAVQITPGPTGTTAVPPGTNGAGTPPGTPNGPPKW